MSIRLTDRDTEILISLQSAGYLTTPQIAKLFWTGSTGDIGPMKACQRRLHKLTTAGLIRHIEQHVKRTEGTRPYLYTLDQAGAEIVADELSLPLSEVKYKEEGKEGNYPFLAHLIATTDIHIAVKQACERNHLELVEWINEAELKSYKDTVHIPGPGGTRIKVGIVPDAFFLIRSDRGYMRFFVEVDRGTVTIRPNRNRGWTRKVLTYTEYFSSDIFKKRYEGKRVRLLTITTTQTRLATMKEATEETGGTSLFYFSTQEQAIDSEKVLTNPIWQIAGDSRHHSLI